MRLPKRVGDVGVAGQRCSGIVSSSSESSQREGAASISSTRVLGAEMECVSSMMSALQGVRNMLLVLYLGVSDTGSWMLRMGMETGRGRAGNGLHVASFGLNNTGVEILRSLRET
jgi:hypothetical protein